MKYLIEEKRGYCLWNDRSQDLQNIHHSLLPNKRKRLDASIQKSFIKRDFKVSAGMQMKYVFPWSS
jgi:hypothetical protein